VSGRRNTKRRVTQVVHGFAQVDGDVGAALRECGKGDKYAKNAKARDKHPAAPQLRLIRLSGLVAHDSFSPVFILNPAGTAHRLNGRAYQNRKHLAWESAKMLIWLFFFFWFGE
jgi:hypothetical protein